jgi:hypothetical protein
MRRYYYSKTGKVRSLGTYHYVATRVLRSGTKTKRALTFAAEDRATADRYALRWCRRRGYNCYRKKRQ